VDITENESASRAMSGWVIRIGLSISRKPVSG